MSVACCFGKWCNRKHLVVTSQCILVKRLLLCILSMCRCKLHIGGEGTGSSEGRRYLYCAACVKSYVLPRGELTPHAQHCLLCSFQALTVRNAETNKEHTVCPKCFR
jgi:hypothetical protein